ncbi:MAG: hypothetical protein OEW85_01910 [Acidimicrobiia bacterium]|nr:hypothetical protein [Acidimicrobiia bacterium]
MPVAQGPTVTLRSALVVGLSGVVAAVLLIGFVWWASQTGDGLTLGDDEFDAGLISQADTIAENGPILYQNPDGGGPIRPIWITHTGTDPEEGWIAIEAVVPGADSSCVVNWNRDLSRFQNSCDGDDTYPFDGAGLTTVPVYVEDERIIVDLQGTRDAPPTTG